MKVTAYLSHPDCSLHDPGWKYPEHQGRLPAVARAVYREMLELFEPLLEMEGVPATADEIALAHDPGYVAAVRDAATRAREQGGVMEVEPDGTPISGASWDAATAAVGCVLTGARAVAAGQVRNAFCAVRPPGHRVGRRSAGAGHGIFNGAAVAALAALEEGTARRVLVVEWAAAYGRGTAEIAASDPRIHFLSLHADPTAPPDGPLLRRLPDGSGLPAVLRALDEGIQAAAAASPPDLILLSLGCDALAEDPTGTLTLSPRDFHTLTLRLREAADALCGGRLVSVLEDGYAPAAMGRAVVAHLRALAGLPAPDA